MEELLEILGEIVPGVDFDGREDLVSGGILKSFDLLTLISEIADAFNVEIPVEDVVPENFESVESIWQLIESLK